MKQKKSRFWAKVSGLIFSCAFVLASGIMLVGCGESAPSASWQISPSAPTQQTAGNNGDMFLDTSTYNIYVKTTSGWQLVGCIKGADGSNGSNGTNGTDANKWLVGTTNPEETTGAIDDIYLNTITGDIFQKTANGWGEKIGNIKGSAGQNANVWLVGETNPNEQTQANLNDIYLNTTNGSIFQNTANGWEYIGDLSGKDGQDANMWLVEPREPTDNDGEYLDMFLDSSTGNIYQKLELGWELTGNFNGKNGQDANKWLIGTSAPTVDDGNVNDLFFNKNNGDVYQKMQGNYWEKIGNLTGESGATWLIGSVDPDNQNGKNNDLYLNTDSFDLFKKIDGVWTLVGNIKGNDGSYWIVGNGEPLATLSAKPGDLYLDSATGNVYQKDIEGVWQLQANLKTKWIIGNGSPIINNISANNGDIYLDQTTGIIYQKTGNSWANLGSIKGQDGTNANAWLTGAHAPDDALGNVNDFYLDTENFDVYQKLERGWENLGSIKGSNGSAGPSITNIEVDYAVDQNNHTVATYTFTLSNGTSFNITAILPIEIASIGLAENTDGTHNWTIPFWTDSSNAFKLLITYSDGTTDEVFAKRSMFDIDFTVENIYTNFDIIYQGKKYTISDTLTVYNPDEAEVVSLTLNNYTKMIWLKNGSDFDIPTDLISLNAVFEHSEKTVYLTDPYVSIDTSASLTTLGDFTAVITYKNKSVELTVKPMTSIDIDFDTYDYAGSVDIYSATDHEVFAGTDYITFTNSGGYVYLQKVNTDMLVLASDGSTPFAADPGTQIYAFKPSALYNASVWGGGDPTTITITLYDPADVDAYYGEFWAFNSFYPETPYLHTTSDLSSVEGYLKLFVRLKNGEIITLPEIDFAPELLTNAVDFSTTDTTSFGISYKGETFNISIELYDSANNYQGIESFTQYDTNITNINLVYNTQNLEEAILNALAGSVLTLNIYEPNYDSDLGDYVFEEYVYISSENINICDDVNNYEADKININIANLNISKLGGYEVELEYYGFKLLFNIQVMIFDSVSDTNYQILFSGTNFTDNSGYLDDFFGLENIILFADETAETYPYIARLSYNGQSQDVPFEFINHGSETGDFKVMFDEYELYFSYVYEVIDEYNSNFTVSYYSPTNAMPTAYEGNLDDYEITARAYISDITTDPHYVSIVIDNYVVATLNLEYNDSDGTYSFIFNNHSCTLIESNHSILFEEI